MNELLTYYPQLEYIHKAANTLKNVTAITPLLRNFNFSKTYNATILLKREDLQQVRSYKLRGAYNKINTLSQEELVNGIICASAGNHAQGVAFSCNKLQIKGTIIMPTPTPKQKIEQVAMFGGDYVTITLAGDTFDDAYQHATHIAKTENKTFIHPFDDEKIIEGQATIGLELLEQAEAPIDYVFMPVGGGGLAAGLSTVLKQCSPHTRLVGVEPAGAPSMQEAIAHNHNVKLDTIDKFVDGAAVQQVGTLTFPICKANLDAVISVPEGAVCQTILDMYNKEAIVVEPAGALTLAALEQYKNEIKGKRVVCIVSGSNNDITRTAEIEERALLHRKLKHYFIVRFPQRAGALKEFANHILGEKDNISFFEYSKKTNRENGSAVVGIELENKEDLAPLIARMKSQNFYEEYLNDKPGLFEFLI